MPNNVQLLAMPLMRKVSFLFRVAELMFLFF